MPASRTFVRVRLPRGTAVLCGLLFVIPPLFIGCGSSKKTSTATSATPMAVASTESPKPAAPVNIPSDEIELSNITIERSEFVSATSDSRPIWKVTGRINNKSGASLSSVYLQVYLKDRNSGAIPDRVSFAVDSEIAPFSAASFSRQIQMSSMQRGSEVYSEVLEARAKPASSNPAGNAAVDKLIEAAGGWAAVNATKSLQQNFTAIQQGQPFRIVRTIAYPDKQVQEMVLPQGSVSYVVTPSFLFVRTGSSVRDVPQKRSNSSAAVLNRDFLNVLRHRHDAKYSFFAVGEEKVDGIQATVVDVDADGVRSRWWIAPDGKLLQERFTEIGNAGPMVQTMKCANWSKFGELLYPTSFKIVGEAGHDALQMNLVTMAVNPTLDPKLFEKP